jgi:hypothetical protein
MTIPASHVSRRFLFALPLDALLGARHFSGASLSPTHPKSATEWRAPSLDLEVSDWEQREYFSLF